MLGSQMTKIMNFVKSIIAKLPEVTVHHTAFYELQRRKERQGSQRLYPFERTFCVSLSPSRLCGERLLPENSACSKVRAGANAEAASPLPYKISDSFEARLLDALLVLSCPAAIAFTDSE
jgi:hypothetical protein